MRERALPARSDVSGDRDERQAGRRTASWPTGWLDDLQLGDVYVERIESLRELIEVYDRQIGHCDARIHRRLKGHRGYEAIQVLRGVGPVLAAVFVAEIGDVTASTTRAGCARGPG